MLCLWYHPESDCLFVGDYDAMGREMEVNADAALCIQVDQESRPDLVSRARAAGLLAGREVAL